MSVGPDSPTGVPSWGNRCARPLPTGGAGHTSRAPKAVVPNGVPSGEERRSSASERFTGWGAPLGKSGSLPRIVEHVQPFELVHGHGGLDDGRLERVSILALDALDFANHQTFGIHAAQPRREHNVAS